VRTNGVDKSRRCTDLHEICLMQQHFGSCCPHRICQSDCVVVCLMVMHRHAHLPLCGELDNGCPEAMRPTSHGYHCTGTLIVHRFLLRGTI
jgi:hypothetical protein